MPVIIRSRLRHQPVSLAALTALAHKMLKAVGEPHAELGLELVGDQRMRRLNHRYRHRNVPTDVLAFSLREAPGPPSRLLGDVVISLHTAARQATEAGHSLEHEVVTLLIHGLLHLCGYDHERGEGEARRMRRKEQTVLRAIMPVPRLTERTPHSTLHTSYE